MGTTSGASAPRHFPSKMDDHHRLQVLDGLRAIAIVLVIGYHYFVRWTPPLAPDNFYPYGDFAAEFWLFRYGDLGVELFFIISGFVISMTLFRSRTIGQFFWKRFSRLFPTMLLCSALTYLILTLIPNSPFHPDLRDFIPSLTFTEPLLWSKVFGVPFRAVDGAYWSLFVEVKFYFWISVLYFSTGAARFFRVVAWAFGILVLIDLLLRALNFPHLWSIDFIFALSALPWFLAGIGFYALFVDAKSRIGRILLLEAIAGLAFLHMGTHAGTPAPFIAMGCGYAVFLALLMRPKWVAWLAYPPLAAIGVASYSLYLLHQSIGVALLDLLRRSIGGAGSEFYALVVPFLTGALIVTSLLVYRYWEAPAKEFLLSWRKALPAPLAEVAAERSDQPT